jgi:hypothetical protein
MLTGVIGLNGSIKRFAVLLGIMASAVFMGAGVASATNVQPASLSTCNRLVMCMFQTDAFGGPAYLLLDEDSDFSNNTYSDGNRANDRMRSYWNRSELDYCFYLNAGFSPNPPFVVSAGSSGVFSAPLHDGISSARPC